MRSWGHLSLLVALLSTCACGSKDDGDSNDGDAGASSGGTAGSGGSTSGVGGGTSGTGSTGGSSSGGATSGGATSGGATSGGATSGGAETGGSAGAGDSGGATSGGAAGSGGTPAGGAGGVACEPLDMSTWQPPAYVPARRRANACTAQEIRSYFSQCLWPFPGPKDCSPFEAGGESSTCGACLAPVAVDANEWGPVLSIEPQRYVYEPNVAGCVELLEGSSACAAKIQAASACSRAACIDRCATDEVIDGAAYAACLTEARSGVCKTYTDQAVCIGTAATAAACGGNDFEALFTALGTVYCG